MTPIRKILTAFAAMAALALPGAAAAQSVNDFQLPPNPSPTPTGPAVQGPVDEEGPLPASPTPVLRAPRTSVTPTPAPTGTSAPTVQPLPRATQTRTPAQRPTAQPAATPAAISTPGPNAPPPDPNPAPLPTATAAPSAQSGETVPGFSDSLSPSSDGAGTDLEPAGSSDTAVMPWPWLTALAALLAALGGFFFWRRQTAVAGPATIAPRPAGARTASPAPPPAAPRAWLAMEVRALNLQRSMMNASLGYRLTVTNRSGAALDDLAIEADLATAHGKLPVEQQLASSASALTPRHSLDRLAPGERVQLDGTIQIPLTAVKVIQQGKALLAVPLLRVRASSGERTPIARNWVVGRKNPQPGGKLLPFRLDAPPQTYTAIGERPLD